MVTSYGIVPTDREATDARMAYEQIRRKATASLCEESEEETAVAVKAAYPEILGVCGLAAPAVEFIQANLEINTPGRLVAQLQNDIAARMIHALRNIDAGFSEDVQKLRAIMAIAEKHKLQPFRDLGLNVSKEISARLRQEFGPQAA